MIVVGPGGAAALWRGACGTVIEQIPEPTCNCAIGKLAAADDGGRAADHGGGDGPAEFSKARAEWGGKLGEGGRKEAGAELAAAQDIGGAADGAVGGDASDRAEELNSGKS
jgi:hypothetical protein